MNRPRSGGVLALTLVVGLLSSSVLSLLLKEFIARSSVVYEVLLNSFTYHVGPATVSLVVATLTLGFTIDVNLLTILGLMAAYYYWKYRT